MRTFVIPFYGSHGSGSSSATLLYIHIIKKKLGVIGRKIRTINFILPETTIYLGWPFFYIWKAILNTWDDYFSPGLAIFPLRMNIIFTWGIHMFTWTGTTVYFSLKQYIFCCQKRNFFCLGWPFFILGKKNFLAWNDHFLPGTTTVFFYLWRPPVMTIFLLGTTDFFGPGTTIFTWDAYFLPVTSTWDDKFFLLKTTNFFGLERPFLTWDAYFFTCDVNLGWVGWLFFYLGRQIYWPGTTIFNLGRPFLTCDAHF